MQAEYSIIIFSYFLLCSPEEKILPYGQRDQFLTVAYYFI